jgi:hypothetical protein
MSLAGSPLLLAETTPYCRAFPSSKRTAVNKLQTRKGEWDDTGQKQWRLSENAANHLQR